MDGGVCFEYGRDKPCPPLCGSQDTYHSLPLPRAVILKLCAARDLQVCRGSFDKYLVEPSAKTNSAQTHGARVGGLDGSLQVLECSVTRSAPRKRIIGRK